LLPKGGFAQTLPLTKISTNNGLPSSIVYSVFQDSKFRYWVCTDNGVSLYDGSSFTNFTMENGLPTNAIFSSFENTNDGKIWFITYGFGLCFYDESKSKFIQPAFNSALIDIFNKKFINSCVFDEHNNLWITYHYHDYLKISPANKITTYPPASNSEIGGFEIVKEANIVFVRNIYGKSEKKNNQYALKRIKNKTIINVNINSNFTTPKVLAVNDTLDVLGYGNELLFITKSDQIIVKRIPSNILALVKDSQNNIWIGTESNGIFQSNPSDFKSDPLNILPLKDNPISSIMQDFNGKIWFSTLTNGIFCIANTGMINYLQDKKVFKIFDDIDELVFLSRGRNIYKTSNKQFDFKETIDKHEIKDIKRGPDHKLYVCKAVYNRIIPMKLDCKNISANGIVFNKEGIFLGGKNFLLRYSYNHKIQNYYELPSPMFSICNLNDNKLLVGCLNGLYIFENHKFTSLTSPSWLKNSRINSVQTRGNRTFVLTDGRGLLIYNSDDFSKFVHIEDKLLQSINCLAFESESILWLGTNSGLIKASLNNVGMLQILSKLTIQDGLLSNEINDLKITEFEIMVATNAGLSVFKKEFKPTNQIYPLFISAVLGNFSDTLFYGYARQINLDVGKNWRNLYIKFIGNRDQSNAFIGRVQFVLLKDKQIINKWTTISDNNIQFTNLEPGNYRFMIKTIDDINNKYYLSKAGFRIKPYFYEITWVRIVFYAVLFLVFFFAIRALIKKINADNELKRNMIKAEINSLRNQMNPHFIFNALNAIQYFIYENSQEKAAKFLSKFSTLIRKSLEFSKLNFISIQAEIRYIKEYIELEKMRFNNKFNYEIEIDSALDLENYYIPPLLMQPLIENSIKHGFSEITEGGFIKISLSLEQNDTLNYSISDNGKGFTSVPKIEADYKTSLSHTILKERFILLRKDFSNNKLIGMSVLSPKVESQSGVQIILKLPLKYDNLGI